MPTIDQRALQAALGLFSKTFVVPDKRAQILKRLTTAERREETLVTLSRWLARSAPLEGADRSPSGAAKRFGDLIGIHLTATEANRTTVGNALALGRGAATLFIADNGSLAVLTAADGTAVLCSRF